MKNLAIIFTLLGTGCGFVKVQGLPGSAASRPTTAPASAAPASAAAPASVPTTTAATSQNLPVGEAGERVTLDPGFSPNPRRATFSGKTELALDRNFGVSTQMCDGYVPSTPAMVVDAPKGFAHLKVTALGGDILFIKMPGGKYYCEEVQTISTNPMVDSKDWPAGVYEIYVGSSSNRSDLHYAVLLEDGAAPVSLPWIAEPRPSIRLTGDPRVLSMVSRPMSAEAGASRTRESGPRCNSDSYFPASPDLEIKVEKRSTFTLGVRAGATGNMGLLGPMTADGRNIQDRCLKSWDEKLTLEPGTYYARLGMRKEDAPSVVHYLIRPTDETGAATTIADELPVQLPLWERALTYHLPFLTASNVRESDATRRDLFMALPKQLFVTVSSDLDKNVATANLRVSSYSGSDSFRDTAALAFPKQGELLLHLDGRGTVLAADGSLFQVRLTDLALPGSAQTPQAARNPQLYFQHALLMAGVDDARDLQARKKRYEQFESCKKKVWKASSGKLDRLYDYPHLNESKIARLRSDIDYKARSKCGADKLKKADEALWATLEKRRTDRRDKDLKSISARMVELFGN